MLKCGAIYRNVGLHQLALSKQSVPWGPSDAATWDAYGWQFTTLEYPYLFGMQASVRLQNRSEHQGEYLFTVAPVGDGFSAAPEQSKEFFFFALHNVGRFTAQPTNHILIKDKSFSEFVWPDFLRTQENYYSAEDV